MTQFDRTPKRCRACIKSNGYDPDWTIYCDPDIDCPYYPFPPWLTRAQRAVIRRLGRIVHYIDEWLKTYYQDDIFRNEN